MELQNQPELHLRGISFSNRSLAEEDHYQDTGDASSSENGKEHSPWLSCNEGFISKQVVHDEITKHQANKTNNDGQRLQQQNL